MTLKKSDQFVLFGVIVLALTTALVVRMANAPERQIEQVITRLSEPLDLNRATLDELIALPGIGPVLARRIIEHRETHGGFKSVEELLEVRGIGPKRLAQIKERVRVGTFEKQGPSR